MLAPMAFGCYRDAVQTLTYSQRGLDLTAAFEGCVLNAYKDPVGIWTIGYGHTGLDVVPGLQWTQQQALDALQHDIQWAETAVNMHVKVQLNQNQFDALVDFVFNLGATAFIGSSLLKFVNAGDFGSAKLQFEKWVHAGGQVLPGLVARRNAESTLFSS